MVISSPEAVKQMLKDQDPACAGSPESMGSKIFWYDSSDIVFSPYPWVLEANVQNLHFIGFEC